MHVSRLVLSHKHKNDIYISVSGQKIPKNVILKNDVITYLCLESNQSLKNEAITLKFGLGIHYTWFSYIYSGFLDTFEIFNFGGKFLKKSVFWILGGQKPKILEIRNCHLVEN